MVNAKLQKLRAINANNSLGGKNEICKKIHQRGIIPAFFL